MLLQADDGWRIEKWWEHDLRRYVDGDVIDTGRFDNYPAVNVSWFDAVAYCRWLSMRLGFAIRLPDEWEWQQAATGGIESFAYPWMQFWDVRKTHIARILTKVCLLRQRQWACTRMELQRENTTPEKK